MRALRTLGAFAALLALPALAAAGWRIEVTANQPGLLYLDGYMLGDTPRAILDLHPGTHQVTVQSQLTGEHQTFPYEVPEGRTKKRKKLAVTFAPPPPTAEELAEAAPPPRAPLLRPILPAVRLKDSVLKYRYDRRAPKQGVRRSLVDEILKGGRR